MAHESITNFHREATSTLRELSHRAGVDTGKSMDMKFHSADVDGKRLSLDVTGMRTNDGTKVMASTASPEINEFGMAVSAPDNVEASLSQHTTSSGEKSTVAQVNTGLGEYVAVEDKAGAGKAYVKREGYGIVKIKNPKAKALIGKLTAKSIIKTTDKIAESKNPKAA